VRVTNIIKVLAEHYVPIADSVLRQAYDWVVRQGVEAKDLLQDDVAALLVAAVTNQAESSH
jgi:exosome complex component RRP4